MFTVRQLVHLAPVAHQAEHLARRAAQGFITKEDGRLQLAGQLGRHQALGGKTAGGTRARALLTHRTLEANHVHRQPAFARDIGGEIHGKTIRVVQPKRIGAGNRLAGFLRDLVKHAHAVFQRFAKAAFFGAQSFFDKALFGRQLRIGHAHFGHQRLHHLPEEIAAHPEHPAVPQRAPDDPSQHIAAAFVGRQHAVDNQERARPDVIGNDPQRLVAQIGSGGELAGSTDQVRKQIDLVIGMYVLQHGGQPFQPHAGVHARRRQRAQCAIRRTVKLHEHQIPDLDVTVAILIRRTGWAAGNIRAVVIENFGARTTRAGIGHLPEIVRRVRRTLVVADAHDALGGDANVVVPDAVGLVIALVDSDPQLVRRQLEHTGEQLPRVGNRVMLEVITKRPVAKHLEKRVMPGGVAHHIQIVVFATGAQAALHIGGTLVTGLFAAEEDVLELHHAGIGEQQGRVTRGHQRTGGHDGMAPGAKVIEESAADF